MISESLIILKLEKKRKKMSLEIVKIIPTSDGIVKKVVEDNE